jgi:hypothetical protein
MEILAIIAAILPFVFDWLDDIRKEKAKGLGDAEDNIQRARKALAKDDALGFAAVAADQHDRVRLATAGSRRQQDDLPADSNGGQPAQ